MRSFLHDSKIDDIMMPLSEQMNVHHFAYHRSYGSQGQVVTDNLMMLDKWLGDSDCVMPKDVSDQTCVLGWSSYHSEKCLSIVSEEFNFNPNGVTFFFKHEDGLCEHLALATRNRDLDLLQNFSMNSDKAANVIAHIRNFIYSNQDSMNWYSYKKAQPTQTSKNIVVDGIGFDKKIFVYGLKGETFVTRSELKCLTALLKLKTIKEISNQLDCSVKTIDCHIANLKKKLGFSNRYELYKIAVNNCLV
jgi:DNA-binding CsgD family transcriptional regulator